MAREMAMNPSNVDVLVHHGSTDAPTVDVVETGVGVGTIVDNISYSEYQGYLEIPPADYTLDVRDETGTVTVARYQAPLATLGLEGTALTVLASGFLDPSQNSNGPEFGLWVATPLGGPLLPLPSVPLSVSNFESENFVMYPNPAKNYLNFTIAGVDRNQISVAVFDMLGRQVLDSQIAAKGSIDVSPLSNGVYTITLLQNNKILTTKKFVKN